MVTWTEATYACPLVLVTSSDLSVPRYFVCDDHCDHCGLPSMSAALDLVFEFKLRSKEFEFCLVLKTPSTTLC